MLGAAPSITSRSLLERGRARQLLRSCARRPAVIVSSGPIGAAPCETQGSTSTPSKRTPTAPPSTTSLAEEQRARAVERARARQAAQHGHAGRASRQLGEDRVGGEGVRDRGAARRRPRRRGRAGPRRQAVVDSARAPRGTARPGRPRAPPPSTATAVPSSTSRPRPSTPPAPQPTSCVGRSASCDALERGLRRREMGARGEHDGQVGARRRPARARRRGRLDRARPGVGLGGQAGADAYAHASDDTPRVTAPPQRDRRSSARPASARPRSPSRSPSGCARAARTRSPSPPTRCRSTRASRSSRARRRAAEQRARSSTGCVVVPAGRRDASAPGEYAELAHAEIDGLLAARPAPDRRRRHRPLPARRARRARPAPAARRPACASAGRPSSRRAARRRCTPSSRARAPWAAEAIDAQRPPAHRARARAARRRRSSSRRDGRHRSCGPSDTRHPTLLVGPDRWSARRSTRASTPASTRWSRPARAEEVRARARGRRVGDRAQGARLRGAAGGRRRGDEAPHAQLRQAPAHLDAQARRRRTLIDVTGRDPDDVAAELTLAIDSAAAMTVREVAGARQRLPDRRGGDAALRADARRACGACATRTSGVGADGVLLLSRARRARLRRAPADLQPRRLGGRAVGQRRARGDPVPAPRRLDRRRHVLDPDRGRRDPPDDHRRRRPARVDMGRARLRSEDFPAGGDDGARRR